MDDLGGILGTASALELALHFERARAEWIRISSQPEERLRLQREATFALMALTAEERGAVLCWFCATCYKHIPPGKSCEEHTQEGYLDRNF